MFEKNDKTLHVYYVLIHVALGILLVASVAVGIIVMGSSSALIGVGILVGGIIITFIAYVVARAIFGLFVDIKLIRNKLYETDNDGLEKYYEKKIAIDAMDDYYTQPQSQSPAQNTAANDEDDKYSRIERLKQFRDRGVISEEEFRHEKNAILKRNE